MIESYASILENTLGSFEQQAHCIVDDASDTAIQFKVIALEIARLFQKLEDCEKQIFPNTADGDYLEKHGAVRGIYKKGAAPSTGKVIFHCKTPALSPILIPKGTLCTSSKGAGLMFQSVSEVVLPANATYAVVSVESTEVGGHTNLAAGYLDVLVTPIAGISSISNTNKTTGGADQEPDELFRQRVIAAFSTISNGANLNYYEQFAKSKGDIWYAKAVYTPNVSNQIALYVENFTHTISESALADLQAEVNGIRTLGVQVTVKKPAPKLVAVSVMAKVDNLANSETYHFAIEQTLTDAISALKIGERCSPAKLAGKLLAIEGVRDISFVNPTAPVPIGAGEIAELGTLAISVEGENAD